MMWLTETCRICAYSASPTIKLVPVFSDEGVKKDLQFKLFNCLRIVVTRQDEIPPSVCEFCISRLDIYFNLLQDSWKGQAYFTHLRLQSTFCTYHNRMDTPSPQTKTPEAPRITTTINQITPEIQEIKEEEDSDDEDVLRIVEDSLDSTDRLCADDVSSDAKAGSSKTNPSRKSPLVCSYCDKKYFHRGDYNKHLRKHTGEQPYQCDICLKKFAHTSNLTRHKLVHTGDRPFECEKCHRKFNRKDKLAVHKRCKTI